MSLVNYLNKNNCVIQEGNCRNINNQLIILQLLASNSNIKHILEIGFNAGHSSDLFLNINPDCTVTSFDIGLHSYYKVGKEFIDNKYPNRHTLIIGDSTKTIPSFNSDLKYDLIFIDGGHKYEVAKADLLNCKRFINKDTIVIMDDTMYKKEWEMSWNIGPNRAWQEGIKSNLITQIGYSDFTEGRGMSWGKYNL
jgi:predicted O-methyltransferase YrrM